MTITESLRREYEAFRTLRQLLEAEGNYLPQETLFEVSAAVDHLMQADQSPDPQQQYDQAQQHFACGAKDLYLILLMMRLDRLRDLPTYLRPDELERFRLEYERIKASVKASVQKVRSSAEGPQSAQTLLDNLTELDRFLESFPRIDPELLMKQRRRKERLRSFLLFLLSALLGAVVSCIIARLLMK